MAKLITGIICLHIVMGLLAGIYQGGGGYVVHTLAASIDEAELSLTLDSTANLIDSSTIIIGGERMALDTVDNATDITIAAGGRGLDGTEADTHLAGAQVYSEEAATAGGMLQVRIAKIADASGPMALLDIGGQLIGIATDLLISPFTFFGTDLWIISAIYAALIAGVLVVIGLSIAGGRRV